jgi:ankyrin repeat protein
MDLLLAQEDIDVNIRNMHGETALWRAAYAGRGSAVARLLRQNDLEINVPDTFHGSTPFALAVANGNVDIAKVLLDTNEVNINFRDRQGRTPLHHAVLSKQRSSVLLLLSRKEIDIQIYDEARCTPLWCAAECRNLDAAQLLIMYGADPNIPDFHGITPLNNAISQRDKAMVELLLNQHNLEIPSHVRWEERAQPPLCAAVCVGDADILRMLLCHVAEVNAYNYHGYQPLLLAVRKGDSSMVKLLLSHKDIDVIREVGVGMDLLLVIKQRTTDVFSY